MNCKMRWKEVRKGSNPFGSQVEKHELSHLYEAKIKNMGYAGAERR